ncbi:hypothetical protein WS86_00375 (plasmid) [Burkholderia savannae]|uniref:Uncharacterized protein n=1 Tax=Burkholderia savannae TaxID=1637837 RepID=A0ABR5T8X2_9BURK|nr:hypothetical protein [Burkholderia savannae]AOJ79241.1 hypothetical protein WS86_00375 [Burkholderia savannae]KWZ39560.1 hypothetical protein WS72_19325 [Burkholderia savannae]
MSTQAETTELDGITEGFYAIARQEGPAPFVAVHHADDSELAFMLPTIDWTAWQINVAISVFEKAYASGERYGAASAQRVIREAVGIFH